MITDTTAKNAPAVVDLYVNSNNRQSHYSCQSTDTNNDNTVEAGNNTELLCMSINMLLKIMVSNNACNATQNILQDFLVQTQQSDRHVEFLPWYSSKNNSSAVPAERTGDVSQDF